MDELPMQDVPEDLSMKKTSKGDEQLGSQVGNGFASSSSALSYRRLRKAIPPPLDLNARTLEEPPRVATGSLPRSPGDLPRECLPIRKRPLLEMQWDLHDMKSPKSAGPGDNCVPRPSTASEGVLHHNSPAGPLSAQPHFHTQHHLSPAAASLTAPSSPLHSAISRLPTSGLALTPSSAHSLSSATTAAFTHFPVPSPCIPKSPFQEQGWSSTATNYSHITTTATTTSVVHSPLHLPAPALLSPATSSYPSTNSSREDIQQQQQPSVIIKEEMESKTRYFTSDTCSSPAADSSSSPQPPRQPCASYIPSPQKSPICSTGASHGRWSQSWPMATWQCFMKDTLIRFSLPGVDAPWQKAEDLAWKDKLAFRVDANSYHFAPHGLDLVEIDVNVPGEPDALASQPDGGSSDFVILRFRPQRVDTSTEILAKCSLDHPYFVREKGWCSVYPHLTKEKYGMLCANLTPGDTCLPPNHPEAVRTPDLCDRFRQFDFNAIGSEPATPTAKEPAKSPRPVKAKKDKDSSGSKDDKPKRPMNAFMLFAKKHRIELIQQYPGKDNRAISVLLGEAWKALPAEERESYSSRAKTLADEQKKLFPDCWKRKKTINNEKQVKEQQQQLTVLVSHAQDQRLNVYEHPQHRPSAVVTGT